MDIVEEQELLSNNYNKDNEEVKQSLKMKPKVSKRLPSAFSSMQKKYILFTLSKKEYKSDKSVPKVDPIQNAVEAEEFRQTQSLLTPIMVDDQRREEMQKGLNKIYEEPIYPKKVKKLEPIGGRKKYHARHDVSVKKDYGLKKATLPFSQVKLEEMITLSVLKGTRNTGSIKKMLHAPTLKLYAVKEIPLINREVRIVLKEWIATWQTAQDGTNDKLSKVYGTFWNVPEGCVSVVMEHMNAGSLENLLESVGALPECVLVHIAHSLLESIQEINIKMKVAHGFIAPSQVLFDQTGKMKLNLGIAQRLNVHLRKLSNKSLVHHNNSSNSPFKY